MAGPRDQDLFITQDETTRRAFGGIAMLNLSHLHAMPEAETEAAIRYYAQHFKSLFPELDKQIETPSAALAEMNSGVAADYAAYLKVVQEQHKHPNSDTSAQSSARILANPLWAQAFIVDGHVDFALTYRSDSTTDNPHRDVWNLPATTAAERSGDCDDYAILKYALLRKQGFPEEKIWLIGGSMAPQNEAKTDHLAVMVEIEGRHYVLDNDRQGSLVPAGAYFDRHMAPSIIMNYKEAYVAENALTRLESVGIQSSLWDKLSAMFTGPELLRDLERKFGPSPASPGFYFK